MLICRNRATFFPSLAFAKKAKKRSYLTSFSNATSVPGKRHTAMFGSPIAANPRVIEFWNFIVTSSSPTFAGRDATRCRGRRRGGDPARRRQEAGPHPQGLLRGFATGAAARERSQAFDRGADRVSQWR